MRSSVMKSLFVALLFGISLLPGLCFAQVQLPTVNLGLTNFEDGFANPGWFLQEFPDYYDADKLKDARGATVPGSTYLIFFATAYNVVFVTQQRINRGWLSFEVLQPWVHLDVDFAHGPFTAVHGL